MARTIEEGSVYEKMKDEIVKCMEGVGTYDDSFLISISILDKLMGDYEMARKEWEEDGCRMVIEYTNKNNQTNTVKNPLYQSMEKLRMDILSYLKELGLTPSGLKKLRQSSFAEDEKKISNVDEVILKLNQG